MEKGLSCQFSTAFGSVIGKRQNKSHAIFNHRLESELLYSLSMLLSTTIPSFKNTTLGSSLNPPIADLRKSPDGTTHHYTPAL